MKKKMKKKTQKRERFARCEESKGKPVLVCAMRFMLTDYKL